jgi:cell division protease FtsH
MIGFGLTMLWWWCTAQSSSSYTLSFAAHQWKHTRNHLLARVERGENSPSPPRRFPFSKMYYDNYLKRLNSQNQTEIETTTTPSPRRQYQQQPKPPPQFLHRQPRNSHPRGGIRIIIQPGGLGMDFDEEGNEGDEEGGELDMNQDPPNYGEGEEEDDSYEAYKRRGNQKSENFVVLTKFPTRFTDVGGYNNIKQELLQCVDLLQNYTKYTPYNVRVPKGLILEGPPGNGKTLLAKAFAGEAGVGFIAVSGSQFQEKYVGVGATRIRELFQLALRNQPCVIFIDEIDAMGRKRSGDGETSGSERDSTLNELLVQMDGFTTSNGIFIVGATNRADLLDPALVRPGRMDKRIFIGAPDSVTRRAILDIHLQGKPTNHATVRVPDLVEVTAGLSCAQIENLLNEAMLYALRHDRTVMNISDVDMVMNRMMVGWQPTEHQFSADLIDRIAVHEMGHVVMGMMSKHHANVSKVTINLYSPHSPGYTVFQPSTTHIYMREALLEHLMILLSGRIAEEVVYNVSVTTGAINDFEEALKLAEKMVVYYGMGTNIIYPSNSDKYKQIIDEEVSGLLNDAYLCAEVAIRQSKPFILAAAEKLKQERVLHADDLWVMLQDHNPQVSTITPIIDGTDFHDVCSI